MAETSGNAQSCAPATKKVLGFDVTPRTQCAHWHSDRDIIAIKHKCCGEYYACISCHDNMAAHTSTVWSKSERDTRAIMCGNCSVELTIGQYLSCDSVCPACSAAFNPGCARHYDLYFEMD
jgi:uncharacterized CHY-type Zn-finger protein